VKASGYLPSSEADGLQQTASHLLRLRKVGPTFDGKVGRFLPSLTGVPGGARDQVDLV